MTGNTYLNTRQTIRRPRYVLIADDTVILDSTKISVTSTNNFHADRMSSTIRPNPDSKTGPDWWFERDKIVLEVKVGFLLQDEEEDASYDGWKTIFKGRLDHVDWYISSNTITIESRDFSAALMDVKTSETFANRTSSEIAKILAARHGLQADVETTTTLVGVYYRAEHDKIQLNSFHRETTEWALLVYLAQQEGFDVWTEGSILHFKRPVPPNATPYLVEKSVDEFGTVTCNVNDLRLSRDLNKSKDIKVIVKTWNHRQKAGHTVSVGGGSSGSGGGRRGGGSGGTSAQTYTYILPGLSNAEALKEANNRLLLLTQKERVISYSESGNLDYGPRDNVLVMGTDTTCDGKYFVDEMTRSLSFDEGFRQSIRAKNHSTKSQVNVG